MNIKNDNYICLFKIHEKCVDFSKRRIMIFEDQNKDFVVL